ncbi:MAG: hypothetical protein HYR84_04410 [Planctomycetes bacterium]|nr:hypothetical protein [Planctomycetota bacterium]
MSGTERELIEVLHSAKSFLALAGNDFAWSSWDNAQEALAELDGLIASIESGSLPDRMKIKLLFAPTGGIQEVSVSSGWGQEFLDLAQRFDAAELRAYETLDTV